MKKSNKKNSKNDESTKKTKDFDVSSTKRPWTLVSNNKPLSRNTIYVGYELPEFLLGKCERLIYTLTDPNGNIVDDNIHQKVKKTVKEATELFNFTWKVRREHILDKVTYIDDVRVKIKKVTGKGWAIIVKRRNASDVSRDTIKVLNYLKKMGIVIDDENICPMYCIPGEERVEK